MEYRFNIRSRDANESYERYVARRLQLIIHHDNNPPPPIEQDTGYRWNLAANDWKMSREGSTISFNYRYGDGGNLRWFNGLVRFIIYTLDIEELNLDLIAELENTPETPQDRF